MTYAIGRADVAAVGDGVGAHAGFPALVLSDTELGFFAGVPADCCGIEEDFGALHGGEASGFGEPLIPADKDADGGVFGFPGFEAKIARREVELFVEEWVVWDVHLAIDAQERAVSIDDGGGVVIKACGAFLEESGDDDHIVFFSDFRKSIGAWAWDALCEGEEAMVFGLAEVLRGAHLLCAEDLCALLACGCCKGELLGAIRGGRLDACELGVGDGEGRGGAGHGGRIVSGNGRCGTASHRYDTIAGETAARDVVRCVVKFVVRNRSGAEPAKVGDDAGCIDVPSAAGVALCAQV